VRALIVGATDQDAAHAHVAHFGEDFPGRAGIARDGADDTEVKPLEIA
jgi:hypothetical protein